MDFKKTIYSVQDGIAVITMNYMKNLNAIDEQMADELLELFARAEADETVKVLVLKGADKAFSAGGDIGFFYQQVQAGGDVSLDDLIARVGKLADYMQTLSATEGFGIHYSYVIPVLCFAFLAFFAMYVKKILKKQGIDYDSEV